METHTHDNRPLYMQLHDLIRDDILNGTYRPGEKILTEEQLSKKYGVRRWPETIIWSENAVPEPLSVSKNSLVPSQRTSLLLICASDLAFHLVLKR